MPPKKTQPTNASVKDYIAAIEEETKKQDALQLAALMQKITQAPPKMWGTSIVGFGHYHYKYKSGREGDWFLTGFAPRKTAISLYLMCDLSHKALDFNNLGQFKKSVGCLYIKRLELINLSVLEQLLRKSIQLTLEQHPS